MVYVFSEPGQETPKLVYVGVTVIVATKGTAPELLAIKDGITPLPLEANPILESEFIHV